MSNRYNSIVETMRAPVITDEAAVLGDFTTGLPGTVLVPGADMNAVSQLEGAGSSPATPARFFDIRDVPFIREIGVFSSLADGLACAPALPNITIAWIAVNAASDEVGHLTQVSVPVYVLNTLSTYELFQYFGGNGVNALMRSAVAAGAVASKLVFQLGESLPDWPFSAYSVGAAWQAAPFQMYVQATVEHSLPLLADPPV